MPASGSKRSLFARVFGQKEVGIFLILLGMVLGVSWMTPSFATRSNAVSILQAIAPIALMAIGQTFVILTAGIDLSVGSVCALSSYAMSRVLISEGDYPLWMGLATALGIGTLCGLFNGFVITKLRVTPFIVTLGMLSACSGLTLGLSGGKQIGLNNFGKEETVRRNILEADGELPGKPEVERRNYLDSEEVTQVLRTESGIWLAGENPAALYLLSASWEVKTTLEFPESSGLAFLADPARQGGLLVASRSSGAIDRVDVEGNKEEALALPVGGILDLQTSEQGDLFFLSREPSGLWTVPAGSGEAVKVDCEWTGEPTDLLVRSSEQVLVALSRPGRIVRYEPEAGCEEIVSTTSVLLTSLREGLGDSLSFLLGETEPERLMAWNGGEPVLVWEALKLPLRDYLPFGEEKYLVSTGNMGALYLLRRDTEPERLHPMTRYKARSLVWDIEGGEGMLVGNADPGGVTTVTLFTQENSYPKAEVFNALFPWAPWVMLALFVVGWLFLRFCTWGTYLYAIGGNETAAKLSGIHVDRVKIFCYALTGFLAGLAGIFLTSKLHTLDPNLAKGYELKVIAAVVIGGTSLMGGEGSLWGTLIGACLLFVLNYALVHLGMEDIWSDLFVGVIIILAAIIDSSRSRIGRLMTRFKGTG